jgi:hypothetical protein
VPRSRWIERRSRGDQPLQRLDFAAGRRRQHGPAVIAVWLDAISVRPMNANQVASSLNRNSGRLHTMRLWGTWSPACLPSAPKYRCWAYVDARVCSHITQGHGGRVAHRTAHVLPAGRLKAQLRSSLLPTHQPIDPAYRVR